MALPKANRLRSRHDFRAVFREGVRFHGMYMTLRALRPCNQKSPSSDTSYTNEQEQTLQTVTPPRIGISISTKVSKKAVVRNRLKRQIASVLYELLPLLAPEWRLVVVVKPTAAQQECGSQQFLQELKQLLVKAEVINGHS
ncbi:ribonuclease P protein component [Plectonema cf. radiosum LEGE 06105]|uniref:Ribonuclease P protein component n=1 Tax=Plectonema cf. radiosum LEGE 06105 TaxID=945769 RepID=A0A8J7EYX5_9CYAN|nr:ribonuclease P protein component [Plectonema radiosum]MBE9211200.1 ribonuclease P protein component [Plectonema cf. radiosum LEGE 06105]